MNRLAVALPVRQFRDSWLPWTVRTPSPRQLRRCLIENTADAFLRGDFNGCLGKRALADVGLVDEDAASDIRDLRSLLSAVRIAKRTA